MRIFWVYHARHGLLRTGIRAFECPLLVDSIPALIHTATPDGYLDYFNKPWLEYLGVTLDKVTGWNWTAYVHTEDVEGSWPSGGPASLLEKSSSTKLASVEQMENIAGCSTGKCHFAMQTATSPSGMDRVSILRNAKRTELALQWTSRDLQESKSKLEEAQRITHVGYWEWDVLTDRVNWSDETYRIYGLRPQEYPMDLATLRKRSTLKIGKASFGHWKRLSAVVPVTTQNVACSGRRRSAYHP